MAILYDCENVPVPDRSVKPSDELPIFTAVKANEVNKVVQLLFKEPKLVNETDKHGRTPLHYSCMFKF